MSYVSCPGVNEPIVKRARIGQNGLPVFFLERFAPPYSTDPQHDVTRSPSRVLSVHFQVYMASHYIHQGSTQSVILLCQRDLISRRDRLAAISLPPEMPSSSPRKNSSHLIEKIAASPTAPSIV